MKKLLSDTVIYALAPQLSRVISILILPLTTPYLTEKDYGIYGLVIAYLNAFRALKDLGMLSVLSNSFYKYPGRYKFIWNKIFTFLSFWNIILAFIVAGILFLILPVDHGNKAFIIFYCCFPFIFFDTLVYFGNRYFQLNQRPVPAVAISIITSVLIVIISYYTIVYLKLGYKGWFIAGFYSQLATFIIYLFLNYKEKILRLNFNFNYKWLKRHFRIALPTIPHSYSSYLLDISDRVLLGLFMVNINLIGLYNLGYTFGQYFNIINAAMAISTSAFYLKIYHKKSFDEEVKIRNITFLIAGTLTLLAFFLGLWMKEIFIVLIHNNSLRDAYTIGIVIVFSYVGNVFYMSSGNKLIASEKTGELWKISLTAGIINVILNLILIPYFNIWGSVIATFFGNAYLYFSTFFLKAYKKDNMGIVYYPIYWFLMISLFLFFTLMLKDINISFKLIVSLILGLTVYFIYYKKKSKIVQLVTISNE